jgi:hypothetical protein
MVRRSCAVLVALLCAAPSFAEPGSGAAAPSSVPSIRLAVDAELARLAAADAPVAPVARQAPPARRPNWVERHPVATATIGGFLAGFVAGWATGEDGAFDDFTREGNGLLVGGICAGSAASVAGIVRAVSKYRGRRTQQGPD